MKEIKLCNRDGANLKLISKDNKLWEFEVDNDHKYILEYIRIGYADDNKTIDMIDPSGGPYLHLGMRLDKTHIIDSILEVNEKLMIHTCEKEL